MEEPQFVLNAYTLAAIGGMMGVLTGAISFLTKALLESKDKQIADLKQTNVHNEEALTKDRDYWRDHVIQGIERSPNAAQVGSPTTDDGG